jgi:hypothetical protein
LDKKLILFEFVSEHDVAILAYETRRRPVSLDWFGYSKRQKEPNNDRRHMMRTKKPPYIRRYGSPTLLTRQRTCVSVKTSKFCLHDVLVVDVQHDGSMDPTTPDHGTARSKVKGAPRMQHCMGERESTYRRSHWIEIDRRALKRLAQMSILNDKSSWRST